MKTKIIFCALSLVVLSKSVLGQTPFPTKEHYDKIYPAYNYVPTSSGDQDNCFLTGNYLSWTLSGLLRMYQATGDKAYLVKFINHCIILQKVRKDEVNSGDPTVWVRPADYFCDVQPGHDPLPGDNTEPVYFNSLLIFPMAEFVNMVIHDPSLYNTTLPIQPYISQDVIDINTLQQIEPTTIPFTDYGHFALWLGYRVEQTLAYMNATYWDNTYAIKGHNTDDCSDADGTCGAGMNWASPYGCALLYMGNTFTNFGYDGNRIFYLTKARLIAELYKETVNFSDLCGPNQTYNFPVLRLMQNGNNSYFWYTRALSLTNSNCPLHPSGQSDISTYLEFVEDVAHGAMDLWFVRACYETQLAPDNSIIPYFTIVEMERFRNTLTKNIYYTNSTGAHFHNTVEGSDNPYNGDENCRPNCPTDMMYGEVLDWMPLYQFEGDSPNVYDILMQHVTGLLNNPATSSLTGAESFLGLSEVVKAQWNMECVNLSLYKRDVVYDQDFNVKNILTVEPESNSQYNTANSFADPVIQTNTFTIESGITSNMTAGEEIILKPGFTALSGCNFTASINPSICTDGQRMGNPNANNYVNVPELASTFSKPNPPIGNKISKFQNSLAIYPNPSVGTTNIYFSIGEKSNVTVKIMDQYGQEIFSELKNTETEQGNYVVPIDTKNLNSGVYYCILQISGEVVQTEKMVVL